VHARRAEAAARAKAVADKKEAVQAQMLVDAKEGGGGGASAATTDDDVFAFATGMGHGFDKRRARPGRREP
jgi:hypothetical protein